MKQVFITNNLKKYIVILHDYHLTSQNIFSIVNSETWKRCKTI